MADYISKFKVDNVDYNLRDDAALHETVNSLLDIIYPVGSLFFSYEASGVQFLTDAGQTWSLIDSGCAIVSYSSGASVGVPYGNDSFYLTDTQVPLRKHSHSIGANSAPHTHSAMDAGIANYGFVVSSVRLFHAGAKRLPSASQNGNFYPYATAEGTVGSDCITVVESSGTSSSTSHAHSCSQSSASATTAVSNVQKSIKVYIWRRVS